jgi:dTDP-4-amino-4,6-dideoxygalactose transaminase
MSNSPGRTPALKVPLIDLKPQHAALREELRAAFERVLDSQQFILGEDVRLLEAEVARYVGTKHAIGCASGSDALLLVMMAFDLAKGDEVITTPFTFFATGSAITRAGGFPRFVDIDPQTCNLDVSKVEAAITPRTRAIMPVHLYGQCVDMTALLEVAAQHDLPVVEDAAQAIGAQYKGQTAGSMGLAGCFSFYPTKNLGAAGDAGIITTDDDELSDRLRRLRVHGGRTEYMHSEVGINSRLDTIQAALLRVKLPHLEKWSEARRQHSAFYSQLLREADLADLVAPLEVLPDARHIFHQYVVRVADGRRDELMEYLRGRGIGSKVYYPVPLHLQECFKGLGYRTGDFPEAERAAASTLALPLFPELNREQQHYVVDTIRHFF